MIFSRESFCLKNSIFNREKRPEVSKNEKASPSVVELSSNDESRCCLTNEQRDALQIFEKQSPGSALLLWGITGSGKTEVYLQMVAKELSKETKFTYWLIRYTGI